MQFHHRSAPLDMSAALDALAVEVQGPVYRPGSAEYESERRGFQASTLHSPDVIVGAINAADVQAAVRFAAAHQLPVAVQATGHGTTTPADRGVLVSTARMSGVHIDPETRVARLQAGVRWEQVIHAAHAHGLAPLSGSTPHAGAVSYTLGGGLSLLARRYGYAADYVRGIEVVIADGSLHEVTAESDPDLFWALRGGRANFGVVTRLDIELVPVSRIYAGGLYFGPELIDDAFEAWRHWTATVPEDMTSSIAVIPFPDLPGVPEPLRGRRIAHVRIAYAGDKASGERLVAPLRAVGPRVLDVLSEIPYTESASIHNDPTDPQASHGTNAMLRELPQEGLRDVLRLTGPDAATPCIVEIRHLGGALARRSGAPSAVGHRAASYVLSVISPLVSADDVIHDLHRRVQDALRPWSEGGFLNFMYGAAATADQVRTAYEPADYERLAALKAVHDPTNMFRHNHNIPPAAR
jgi:FAD/FMN-containing dehydrogenase